jgi:hypothetical protein
MSLIDKLKLMPRDLVLSATEARALLAAWELAEGTTKHYEACKIATATVKRGQTLGDVMESTRATVDAQLKTLHAFIEARATLERE